MESSNMFRTDMTRLPAYQQFMRDCERLKLMPSNSYQEAYIGI